MIAQTSKKKINEKMDENLHHPGVILETRAKKKNRADLAAHAPSSWCHPKVPWVQIENIYHPSDIPKSSGASLTAIQTHPIYSKFVNLMKHKLVELA